MTAYTLPVGSTPEMITTSEGRVWYTEDTSGTIGMLDPITATGTSTTLAETTAAVTPACSIVGPGTSTAALTGTGSASWVTSSYTTTVDGGGWTVYQLPPDASPWGIAVIDGDAWVADQGRQKLLRLSTATDEEYRVYLPLLMK
jgi:streptogramin lyase